MQLDDLKRVLEYSFSQCERLDMENQFLRQEVVSMEGVQKTCEELEKEKRHLEEEILTLQRARENTSIQTNPTEEFEGENQERVREKILEETVQFLQVNFSVMCFSSFTAKFILDVYVICGSSVPLQQFVFEISRNK